MTNQDIITLARKALESKRYREISKILNTHLEENSNIKLFLKAHDEYILHLSIVASQVSDFEMRKKDLLLDLKKAEEANARMHQLCQTMLKDDLEL